MKKIISFSLFLGIVLLTLIAASASAKEVQLAITATAPGWVPSAIHGPRHCGIHQRGHWIWVRPWHRRVRYVVL